MINESLILVRFTFAANSHFIDIIADKFLTRYYKGLKYIVTDVRWAPFLVQKFSKELGITCLICFANALLVQSITSNLHQKNAYELFEMFQNWK